MKRNLWPTLGAVTFLITASVGCLRGEEQVKPIESAVLQATPPEMVLLKGWLQSLEDNGIPTTIGRIRPLTSEPINTIDWENDEILSDINAQLFNGGKDVFLGVGVDRTSTQNGNWIDTEQFYWNAQGLHRRTVTKKSYERDGWIYIPETTGTPVGVGGPAPITEGARIDSSFARPMMLQAQNGKIEQVPSPTSLDETKLNQKPRLRWDEAGKFVRIVEPASQKVIGDLPYLLQPTFKAEDVEDHYNQERDVRVVKDKIVVGGLSWNLSRRDGSYFWQSRSVKGSQWTTEVKPFKQTYLQGVLPSFLHKILYKPRVGLGQVKVWKDGSLIFTMNGTTVSNGDVLESNVLVMQPIAGPTRLLSWRVQHSYVSGIGAQEKTDQQINKIASTDAFNHVWFPTGEKAVVSVYAKSASSSDFLFDVDAANNVVIYLLQGRLWAVDLSPSISTATQ